MIVDEIKGRLTYYRSDTRHLLSNDAKSQLLNFYVALEIESRARKFAAQLYYRGRDQKLSRNPSRDYSKRIKLMRIQIDALKRQIEYYEYVIDSSPYVRDDLEQAIARLGQLQTDLQFFGS